MRSLPQKDLRAAENRDPAPWPRASWTWAGLAAFPGEFDAFFNDHFGLRSQMVHFRSLLHVVLLRESPKPNIVLGKHGWLLTRPEKRLFTDNQLQQWLHVYQERQTWLKSRNIRYLLVVAPAKEDIYPEMLPNRKMRMGANSGREQFLSLLRGNTDIEILDLKPLLLSRKSQGRLFYTNDFHWSPLAAFFGYQAIIETVGKWYPSVLPPLPTQDTTQDNLKVTDGNLARAIALEDYFVDELPVLGSIPARGARAIPAPASYYPPEYATPAVIQDVNNGILHVTVKDDPHLPTAVFFHDSFLMRSRDFYSEHFRRAMYVWNWHPALKTYWNTAWFNPSIIEAEHPDIFIEFLITNRIYESVPLNDMRSLIEKPAGASSR